MPSALHELLSGLLAVRVRILESIGHGDGEFIEVIVKVEELFQVVAQAQAGAYMIAGLKF